MAITQKKKKEAQMLTFKWEATTTNGKKIKGQTRALNEATVKNELKRQGISNPIVKKQAAALFGSVGKAITPGDIALFARQLATMMKAGVPLIQSFDIVGKGNENPRMQDLIFSVKTDVESGTALAEALSKQPLYFDDLFCNLVRAGESAGVLEDLLDKIATYKEKTESMKKKVKKALTYPIAIMVMAVVVTAIIMIFVIPQFEDLFSGFGAELPAFTLMVIQMSKVMQEYWWMMLGGIIIFINGFKYVHKRSKPLRQNMDKLMLHLPVVGIIVNKAAIARFARTMATMFSAGVPMVEALESVAGATGNIVYSDAVMSIREEVATGQSLQLSIKQQDIFPVMVVQMIAIGEESGAIDTMLSKVADYYEEEVDNLVDNLSSLMEPVIMAVLGVLVGGLVIAMYLPIFKMGSVV